MRFFCVCLNLVVTVWAAISYKQLFGSNNFLDQTLIENTPPSMKKNYLHAERHEETSRMFLKDGRGRSQIGWLPVGRNDFSIVVGVVYSLLHHFFFGNEQGQLTFPCWRLFFRSHRTPNRFSFFMVTIWFFSCCFSFLFNWTIYRFNNAFCRLT